MNKIIRFIARHMVVSALSIIFSLVAIISSAYGFSKVADITSLGASIPQVKTVDQLRTSSEPIDPTPTISLKPGISVPSVTPGATQTPSLITPSITQSNPTVTNTPSFEEDEEVEDVAEEDRQEVHIQEEDESDDK